MGFLGLFHMWRSFNLLFRGWVFYIWLCYVLGLNCFYHVVTVNVPTIGVFRFIFVLGVINLIFWWRSDNYLNLTILNSFLRSLFFIDILSQFITIVNLFQRSYWNFCFFIGFLNTLRSLLFTTLSCMMIQLRKNRQMRSLMIPLINKHNIRSNHPLIIAPLIIPPLIIAPLTIVALLIIVFVPPTYLNIPLVYMLSIDGVGGEVGYCCGCGGWGEAGGVHGHHGLYWVS